MTELQKLDLTEKDFDLMVEGLDSLSEKGMAGELMADLFSGMLVKDDPVLKEKLDTDRNTERQKRERQKKAQQEEVRILQGKLLMLKRYLASQSALGQAADILNHVR